jgi:acyl-CoA thioesterase FadM
MTRSLKTLPEFCQYRQQIPQPDANTVATVDFSHYFALMGKCRDVALQEMLPNADTYLKQGFGLMTEYAHIEFAKEGMKLSQVLVRMGCRSRTRTRMEFEFEFIGEPDGTLLGKGRNAVVWVNPQHNPAIMPEELYNHAALRAASTMTPSTHEE